MSIQSLVDEILRHGGTLTLSGNTVKYRIPEDAAHLVGQLKERKPELVDLLKTRGGRVATFPHCPRCAGYALYRKDNIGTYECLTCELQNIEESVARRLM